MMTPMFRAIRTAVVVLLTGTSARGPRLLRSMCTSATTTLEPELRRELHDTGIESRRDGSEAGRAQLRRGCAEIRRVQQVEHLQTQLDRTLASEPDAPHHGEIHIAVRRPPHGIARGGSDGELIG